ncbi:MAG: hypothetical protein ACR2PF_17490 [Rhizobiaceae bacterium]
MAHDHDHGPGLNIGGDETITEQPGLHQSGVLIGNNVASTIIGGDADEILIGDGTERLGLEGSFETFDDTATLYGYASTDPTTLGAWDAPQGYAVLDETIYGLPDSGRGNVLELASNVNASYSRVVEDLEIGQAVFVQFDYVLTNAGRDENVLNQEGVEVVWNGEIVLTGKPDNFNVWEQFSVQLEGGSGDGTDTLEIRGIGQSDWWAGLIDNVGVFTQSRNQGGVDHLIGGGGNDELHGGGGRDWLEGGDGKDKLFGGEGVDTAYYANAESAVTVNLSTGKGSKGEARGDTYDSVENAHGSDFNDVLKGSKGDNRLIGRDGDDKLSGGGGDDTLLGGRGADNLNGGGGSKDVADYDWSTEGVDVNLTTGVGSGGYAEGDTLTKIEFLYGSHFDDVLTGDDNVNRLVGDWGDDTLVGMAGNDILVGGHGADHLDGGDGDRDAADYKNSEEAVVVDLANGGTAGDAAGDTYNDVEFVYGSSFNDMIIGDDAINRLVGGFGDDVLSGMSGNDYILGEEGDDTLTGGDGDDVFLIESVFDNDTITDFEFGVGRTDRIWFKGLGLSESDLVITDTTHGALIEVTSFGTLTLTGVDSALLASDDFIF